MKNLLTGICLIAAAACLAVAGFMAWSHKPLASAKPVTITAPKAPGDASIICYSLLKDFSEDPVMKAKVGEVIADNDFSDKDCDTLVDYSKVVKAEEERRRKIQYMKDTQDNLKS